MSSRKDGDVVLIDVTVVLQQRTRQRSLEWHSQPADGGSKRHFARRRAGPRPPGRSSRRGSAPADQVREELPLSASPAVAAARYGLGSPGAPKTRPGPSRGSAFLAPGLRPDDDTPGDAAAGAGLRRPAGCTVAGAPACAAGALRAGSDPDDPDAGGRDPSSRKPSRPRRSPGSPPCSLSADAETIHAYARRQQTVSEHQQRIGQYLRLRTFDTAAGEQTGAVPRGRSVAARSHGLAAAAGAGLASR